MLRTAVVALGGNAFTREHQSGTYEEMASNAHAMAAAVHGLRQAGWRVVVVHGNGPQVGNLAIQQDAGEPLVPGLPLFALGSMTQGMLGSLFCLALREVCGDDSPDVVAVVTHMRVDARDPAFDHPTKPIGPFFSAAAAQELAQAKGWQVVEDAGRGYRRVVPSPAPVEIVEARGITRLLDEGFVVVAAGGGGIPVTDHNGRLAGVEAVIDKDLAAALLAVDIGAHALVLVTGVDAVMLDFGTPRQRAITTASTADMRQHLLDGQFPEGSMAPKVRACLEFLDAGGGCAVITCPELAPSVLAGHSTAGTRIVSTLASQGAA
ncbi:carbamate kinase [Planosporangium flavigriseum]|uniref:Carbamate kinase n=1 Tax=Planosporangium flavigriseum TaxID=373681 RepID=A0A8J3LJU0_9ACTN|nr:carbamate kinase [Planosporangium flavigriseum]NJC63026.1 carbamate kinase [Planosporangium flavigriseum]GIG73102.1 carbamate kinase [Planosporangium flavigriseum]